jgi:quinol-cytochrome oxidoreductase complex cytochrome b subunit
MIMADAGAQDGGERLAKRLWRSVFRRPLLPSDDRERIWVGVNTFVLHFRPIRLPKKALTYTHTFGLGGSSLILVLLLVGTGVLLMFAYEPAPGDAYASIVALQQDVLFGKFVRSVHHWSANFLIVVVLLHLLRTYLTGAYFQARQFNWIIGLALLACVLASNFTGYLLPWDQLSYWAITVSTGMLEYTPIFGGWLEELVLGGPEIGQATLINFYTLHTTLIPVTIFVLMAFHFWRVRKAGGVVVPRSPNEEPANRPEKVLAFPNLFLREFVAALVLIAFVLLFSALFTASLGEVANPGMSPNPAKPPWYFVGFQELLLHFDPTVAVLVLPLAGVISTVAIPYLDYEHDTSGVPLASGAGRRFALVAAPVTVVVTALLVVMDEYWIDVASWLWWLPNIVSNGLVPVSILLVGLWYTDRWLHRRLCATKVERVQTLFIITVVAFATLTVIGIWFRGPGMALTW